MPQEYLFSKEYLISKIQISDGQLQKLCQLKERMTRVCGVWNPRYGGE